MSDTIAGNNKYSELELEWVKLISANGELNLSGSLDFSVKGIIESDIPLLLNFLNQHPEVKYLDLGFNKLGDDSIKMLASNTTLDELILNMNQIGDAGAIALAGNTTLKYLSLGANQIGKTGATALAGNMTLKGLNLYMTQIGVEGRAVFDKPKAERVKAAIGVGVKYNSFPSLRRFSLFALQGTEEGKNAVQTLENAGMANKEFLEDVASGVEPLEVSF